jgi:hypothetical protein
MTGSIPCRERIFLFVIMSKLAFGPPVTHGFFPLMGVEWQQCEANQSPPSCVLCDIFVFLKLKGQDKKVLEHHSSLHPSGKNSWNGIPARCITKISLHIYTRVCVCVYIYIYIYTHTPSSKQVMGHKAHYDLTEECSHHLFIQRLKDLLLFGR